MKRIVNLTDKCLLGSMAILLGDSKVKSWKRSYSLVHETRKSGVVAGRWRDHILRSIFLLYCLVIEALLRPPAQSGMASASRSARLSLAFEGNLRSNINSPLLTKQVCRPPI